MTKPSPCLEEFSTCEHSVRTTDAPLLIRRILRSATVLRISLLVICICLLAAWFGPIPLSHVFSLVFASSRGPIHHPMSTTRPFSRWKYGTRRENASTLAFSTFEEKWNATVQTAQVVLFRKDYLQNCVNLDETYTFNLECATTQEKDYPHGLGSALFAASMSFVLAQVVTPPRRFHLKARRWNYGDFRQTFSDFSDNSNCQISNFAPAKTNRDADVVQLSNGSLIVTDPHAILELNIFPPQYSHHDMFERNLPLLLGLEIYAQMLSVSARAIFAPKPEILETIRKMWIELTRNNNSYAFVHVRRGDKRTETPNTPVEKYLEKVEAVNSQKKYRTRAIFLMCDGDQTCEEFRNANSALGAGYSLVTYKSLLKQLGLWTETAQTRKGDGHSQVEFDHLPENERLAQTAELVVSAYIGALSNFVVCTFSSNLCRLLALLRGSKLDSNDIYSLDWTRFLLVYPPRTSMLQNFLNLFHVHW